MAQASPNPQHTPLSGGLWPYEEAARLKERVASYEPGRPVIFQSGFGPSGLPHLGTLAEVLRPSYVRRALQHIEPSRPSRLIVFIDDMDGLRKVPENLPNRERMEAQLGKPVSRIEDPFDDGHSSFADHMMAQLGGFLAPVEVDYELIRSSKMYWDGGFDEALKLILEKHREIIALVTPTLREENRKGWSPFMPVCPNCGQVNSTLVTAYHPDRTTVEFSCERTFGGAHGCSFKGEQTILGGNAKVQWKVDWALRWYVLKVDYELYGKDLTDSVRLSGPIVKLLGGKPPLGFPFEMFLDEEGHKVSKSVGRGVTAEQWQRYAPIEVLKFFLLINPRRARKLFLDTIPQYVDEYLDALREYAAQDRETQINSPLGFVLQSNSPRRFDSELSFAMMMNLVPAVGNLERDFLWKYLRQYDPGFEQDDDTRQLMQQLLICAANFYRDFIESTKQQYAPTAAERDHLITLAQWLQQHSDASAEEIEKQIYDLGRANYEKPGKIFPLMYRSILGQERGPRLGAFIRLATPARVVEVLNAAIARAA